MGIWYDKKAYELLKKCSDAKDLTEWNEFRKATNYASINLRFAELENFYLQKAELQNVDFRGSLSLNTIDFKFANLQNAVFLLKKYYLTLFLLGFFITFFLVTSTRAFNYDVFLLAQLNTFILKIAFYNITILALSFVIFNQINQKFGFLIFIIKFAIFNTVLLTGFESGILGAGGLNIIQQTGILAEQSLIHPFFLGSFIASIYFYTTLIAIKYEDKRNESLQKTIALAFNPEKVNGFNKKYLLNRSKSLVQELQVEASALSKVIESTHNDEQKERLIDRLEKLEEKIQFYDVQEENANLQKTQIENIIFELQFPYRYIHQTITKIEFHNRFYYGAIVGLIGIFIYAILHGYIDQKMLTFISLFTKETLPSFGTIFGVILFYGSPVLIGISLIIYFIAQINKNIDKITELQEQERNIKQIASTIKAKAQIGMSDDEFVKETKNLIQKYQEGMMAGMFTKEKILDKEDKSSSSTYREKMIANSMSKLLMQALKK